MNTDMEESLKRLRKKDCPLPLTKSGHQLHYRDLWEKGECARLIPNHLKCPDSRLVGARTETYVTLRLVMLVCFYQLIEGVIEGWWIWVPEGVPQPPNEFPYGYPAHVQGQGYGWIGPQAPPQGVVWPGGALHPHPPAPPWERRRSTCWLGRLWGAPEWRSTCSRGRLAPRRRRGHAPWRGCLSAGEHCRRHQPPRGRWSGRAHSRRPPRATSPARPPGGLA